MRLELLCCLVACSFGVYSSLLQSGGKNRYTANETQLPPLGTGNSGATTLLEACETVCKNVQDKMNTGGWRLACAGERKRIHREILGQACKTGLQSVVDRCLNACAILLSEHWEIEEWNPGYGLLDGCANSRRQPPVPQGGNACLRGLKAGIKMINQAIDAFLEVDSIGRSSRRLEEENENWRSARSERSKLKFTKRGQGCRTCSSGR